MGHIITLTGPAHCGKSTVSHMFKKLENEYFHPVLVAKYTTRERRLNDEDVICVANIPKNCNLIYEQYGVRYGVVLEKLYEKLEKGFSPIIVINDIRAVEDLKSMLGNLVYSIFLYRRTAVYDEFYAEEAERASRFISEEEISQNARTRFEKAQAIYRIYIENIYLFDRVVLNTYKKSDTFSQVKHIVDELQNQIRGLNVWRNK